MKWIDIIRDPNTGMVNRKLEYAEDIYFTRQPDNRFYLTTTEGILRNCWIRSLDIDNKSNRYLILLSFPI